MDKIRASAVFREYCSRYDTGNVMIRLKVDHTFRVAGMAERIGASAGADTSFSWFLGLLHDIGRFEQFRRYGTFVDQRSADHAELGADILFKDGVIDSFTVEELAESMPDWRKIAESAVRLHNKYVLPGDMDHVMKEYCNILRDADKCDIFRVIMTEPPYLERNQRILSGSADKSMPEADEEVMRFVGEHRCVAKELVRTDLEGLICQCCMAFELVYPISRDIVLEQGYLNGLLSLPLSNEAMLAQLKLLRDEINKAWEVSGNAV